jgi:hypothetical protein
MAVGDVADRDADGLVAHAFPDWLVQRMLVLLYGIGHKSAALPDPKPNEVICGIAGGGVGPVDDPGDAAGGRVDQNMFGEEVAVDKPGRALVFRRDEGGVIEEAEAALVQGLRNVAFDRFWIFKGPLAVLAKRVCLVRRVNGKLGGCVGVESVEGIDEFAELRRDAL